MSITNGIVSSKCYDKRDDFNFEIVNFPFLDGDVPRSLPVLPAFFSNADDINNRNTFMTSKLFKQGY